MANRVPAPASALVPASARTPARPSGRRPFRSAVAAAALGALIGPAAWAQAPAPEAGTGPASPWGLGLGVAYDRQPYRDFDDKAQALPLLVYENRWVSIFGPRIDLKLPSAGPVSFRLRAAYSGDGYEDDDSPYLRGMDKRKSSFWLGGAATWRNEIANVSAEWLGDASGHSKGQRFKLQAERRFQAGAFDLTPRLAAQWVDSKYVDYYYGVRSSEVRLGRSVYEGDATVNVEAGLRIGYGITPKQSVFLDVSTTRLGSGIKDSPLVDRSSTSGVRIGYFYRF
ncbi:MipA/OmpV family protein [Aquincola agrisoli]